MNYLSKIVITVVASIGTVLLLANHGNKVVPLTTTATLTPAVRPTENFTAPAMTIPTKPLTVHNLNTNSGTTLVLNTEVNEMSADKVIGGIQKANARHPGRPIYLLLDSPGGSVLDGARIISAMQASRAPVYTVCVQICASMAAMILEYGTERYAVDRSIVMFHPASIGGIFSGELDKIVSRFTFLKRYVDKMDHYVATRSDMTYDAFKAKSSQELWIDAEDALGQKLIDKVVRVDMSSAPEFNFGENRIRNEYLKLSR